MNQKNYRLMFRIALNHPAVHSEDTIMMEDNLGTDIRGGIEAGLETVLVSSGMTAEPDIVRSPFRPNQVVRSAAEIDLD